MHIVYSALRTQLKNGKAQPINQELTERYEAYQATCNKYREEIAAIQKYMPGWAPPFELKA
ncbi:hypothetical protein [Mucilaginibacter aquariorum]|uniref:Transposase n=1 Tax=Mucilaginibacter aquariorum TaxID=2967225 RepID=A0ABT1T4C8_9SPHI|nr:hypothetical protein [Mucilaginibacter aquariorum]MCQ6958793.1 hypothetical protein [Mucilaginibacter aquariorum]